MVPLIALGAVGALVYTGYRAYRKEADKLEREDAVKRDREGGERLERDPETGRYRLPKSKVSGR